MDKSFLKKIVYFTIGLILMGNVMVEGLAATASGTSFYANLTATQAVMFGLGILMFFLSFGLENIAAALKKI